MRKASPVRVIAGSLGGRTLHAPRGDKTRPTSDKVRQALFNILANILANVLANVPGDIACDFGALPCVLDLYAGSGALGIEALSRGARRATFVDEAAEAVRVITRNVTDLDLTARADIIRGDVEKTLVRLRGPFDLVFVDPPYRLAVHQSLVRLAPLLAPGATVVVEHDRRSPPADAIGPLSLQDRRRYGDTEVSFFR